MSRLTDKDSYCFVTCADDYIEANGIGENCKFYKACFERKMYDKLKHYEDLEEQQRLIELPCKVGTEVYFLTTNEKIMSITLGTLEMVLRHGYAIGEGLYLTKAEAEAKLAELKEGGDDENV